MSNDRTIPMKVDGATVTFTVKVNGTAIPRTWQVFSVTVLKEANRIPQAKITIIDGDPSKETFAASSDAIFLPGGVIEIFAGHQSKEDLIYKGVVVKHAIAIRRNGASQLKLDCRDTAYNMTLGRFSASYKDMKDTDIASNLFSKYKLNIGKIDKSKFTHPEMVQYDSSDWDFLLGRLDVNGKLVLINDGTVSVVNPSFSAEPVLTLQYGATILELDAEMDARNQFAGVTALTWDVADQEVAEVTGQAPASVKEAGNFPASQLAGVTQLKAMLLRHGGNIPQEELQAWADAARQKSLLAKIRGRVTFDGFAAVKPGDLISLQGVGDRFNGKLFVSAVRHDISDGAWTTSAQFGMEPEWYTEKLPQHTGAAMLVPPVHGLQTGIVAQLKDDPAGEDRILIKIPMVDISGEGVWARIATLDAGKERGSFFRPDIGDEVLVGFITNDPREAIVLGMLNSSKKPAPLSAKDENKEKGFFFASKMKILFQEEDKSMTLETPAGNRIVLSEKEKGITLEDQNGNKLVMNADGITLETAKKITLKSSGGDIELQGVNIKNAAQAQFKAEGSAGMELSSSAIAKLKGSLVQIN
ncbi:type VI secretion system tip protein VgrG [Chitinophaga solisilvae]|uniref:type VI secretion system tip protein VgrG n=1 Tax=Chitinophaga solisilvae TaxID=1233460 RepID=UPI00136AA506|nr:type VI secretion system tip protein VgrG [Chitinophaga solisilvae]